MTKEDKTRVRECIRTVKREVSKHVSDTKKNKNIREELKGEDISLYLLGVTFGAQIATIQMKKLLNDNEKTNKPDNNE